MPTSLAGLSCKLRIRCSSRARMNNPRRVHARVSRCCSWQLCSAPLPRRHWRWRRGGIACGISEAGEPDCFRKSEVTNMAISLVWRIAMWIRMLALGFPQWHTRRRTHSNSAVEQRGKLRSAQACLEICAIQYARLYTAARKCLSRPPLVPTPPSQCSEPQCASASTTRRDFVLCSGFPCQPSHGQCIRPFCAF